MEANRTLTPDANPPTWAARLRRGVTTPLRLWLLLALPVAVQAQYDYTTENNQLTITGYTGPDTALVIPDTINGLPVTKIGNGAFQFRSGLTSVTIPNSVTNIGSDAFANCTGLTSVTIGNSVISIGGSAFYGCTGLTSVTIPDRVTTLEGFAFYGCTRLTSVTIPNSVTNIGGRAFSGCTGLTSVTIPNRVTTLGGYAFSGCTNLSSVTIPNSVTSIRGYAFAYCTGLKEVYFQGNAPSFDFGVFLDAPSATVYYLPGTTGWRATFAGRRTVLWNSQIQTGDAGFGVRAGQFGFTITGPSGLIFVVEAAPDLANPVWTPVGTNTLTAGSAAFTDPQWASYPARFYRLRMP